MAIQEFIKMSIGETFIPDQENPKKDNVKLVASIDTSDQTITLESGQWTKFKFPRAALNMVVEMINAVEAACKAKESK